MKPTGVTMGELTNLSVIESDVTKTLFVVNVSSKKISTYNIGMEYNISENKLSSIQVNILHNLFHRLVDFRDLHF